jgi:nucleoside-diphosphate-sugar epimerase
MSRFLVLGSEGVIGASFTRFIHEQQLGEVIPWDLLLGSEYDLREQGNMPGLQAAIERADFVLFAAYDVGGSKYLASESANLIVNNMKIMANIFPLLTKPYIFLSSQMAASSPGAYSDCKRLGERCVDPNMGVIVRLWNVYGHETPSLRSHVIPDFIHSALATGRIDILTDGREERQFLHASDCSRVLYQIFIRFTFYRDLRKPIDLSNHIWTSILEVAVIIQSLVPGTSIHTGHDQNLQGRLNPSSLFINLVESPIPLKEGIARMVEQQEAVKPIN